MKDTKKETPVNVSPKAGARSLCLYKEREAPPVLWVNNLTVANYISAENPYHSIFFLRFI